METETRNSSFSSQTNILLGNGIESAVELFDQQEDYFRCRRELMKVNAFEHWHLPRQLYPRLLKVARSILSIQATSVASERLRYGSPPPLPRYIYLREIQSVSRRPAARLGESRTGQPADYMTQSPVQLRSLTVFLKTADTEGKQKKSSGEWEFSARGALSLVRYPGWAYLLTGWLRSLYLNHRSNHQALWKV